ncbi:MAG: molecular chaperone DnaJ [Pseudomonadota bacterium]
MGLIWLVLAAIAVWALIRLGRQTEGARRGHWRISATVLAGVMLAGGVLAMSKGSWVLGPGLVGAGLWLTLASRIRYVPPKSAEDLSEAEARAILGVGPIASPEEINAAWRRLMARAHPDQGGTEGLAARVNAARDRLKR